MVSRSALRARNHEFTSSRHSQVRPVLRRGKRQKFESTCNDDGKRYVVSAAAEAEGVRVRVNNQERMVSADIWLTSYWNRPDNNVVNKTIPVVDADTGRDLEAKVTYVGQE